MRQLLITSYTLLSSYHKRKIIPLIVLLTLGSILDFFSLASFLPVVLLIIHPDQTLTHSWAYYAPKFSVSDPINLAVGLTVGALVFTIIKTQTQVWITHKKATYAYAVATNLASNAISKFLESSYLKFTGLDYTRQMNRITDLPFTFANNIIIPVGTILSEALVSLLLLFCIAWYNPYIFFFLGVLLIPLILLYRVKRVKIKDISKVIKTIYPLLLKYTLQAIEGLIEIRTYRKEVFFKTRISKTHQELSKAFALDHTTLTSTARLTELVATFCVGTLIIYALVSRQSYADTLLLLSLYVGVSFRVIPSINRIFSATLQVKSHEYIVHELNIMTVKCLEEIDYADDHSNVISFNDSVELRNISFSFEGQPSILNNASLVIHKGEKIELTGKSGAGKTSLLLVLLRFLKESQGEILVDGKRIEEDHNLSFRKLIGYVSQYPYILDASVIENIAFGVPPEEINNAHVQQLIVDLDLQTWVNTLPERHQTIIGEKGIKISGGQRQRLAIARALYQNAEILLLDEITNQLDKQTEKEVLDLIHNRSLQKKTVIMVSHQIGQLNYFDSIYELKNGAFEKKG